MTPVSPTPSALHTTAFGWMNWLMWAALVAVLCAFGSPARAFTQAVQTIEFVSPERPRRQATPLPHFIEQNQSGLLTVHWRIRLPPTLSEAEIPALLIPQTVQGARFSLGGQLIYEVAFSDEQTFRNAYAPTLMPLPKSLLSGEDHEFLDVEQTGHLRGWFIAPMLLGELKSLQPLFNTYVFVSQSLKTTVNVLCGFLGGFLVFVGLKSRTPLYLYGGMIAITWSLLIGLSLVAQLQTDLWWLWRLSLYFLTGWLVYFEVCFNFAVYQKALRPAYALGILVFMNVGWLVFALWGKSAEFVLDTLWTGLVLAVYVGTLVWMVGLAIQRRDWSRITAISLFFLVAMALSSHDYLLQTGLLPIHLPEEPQDLWLNLALQPIYVAHLALPAFIALTLWLVGKSHIQITRNQWQHELQLSQTRERIVSDIHDGVGARINLLLWSLRTTPPEPAQISHELQNCMDELRFAINPPDSGHATLHHALETLVQRLSATAPAGLQIHYQRTGQSPTTLASDMGLHLYKATQECLSNALRHSGATHIVVSLDHRDTEVVVAVEDNGSGIPDWDNARQIQTHRRVTSLGLLGLQKRMQHRRGHCDIDSSMSRGTRVRLRFPISAGQHN